MPSPIDHKTPVTSSIGKPDELQLTCSELGASILSLRVPHKGDFLDVVTGYSELQDYLGDPYYMGAMCGRYAGRLNNATFALNGSKYSIESPNPGEHALHGGARGFNTCIWKHASSSENELTYSLNSPDGDQGFPGRLDVNVTYAIEHKTCLAVSVVATCDRDTVVNLVNHAYFNLNELDDPIDNHCVTIAADAYTPLDSRGIPTGVIASVSGSRYDLRSSHSRSDQGKNRRIGIAQYDQNYVLGDSNGDLRLAALVSVEDHSVSLAVHTTLPGLQFYTGDQLGGVFEPRAGLCLEAQHFPDAPNQPNFPSTVLHAGSRYRSKTVYAFGDLNDIC